MELVGLVPIKYLCILSMVKCSGFDPGVLSQGQQGVYGKRTCCIWKIAGCGAEVAKKAQSRKRAGFEKDTHKYRAWQV